MNFDFVYKYVARALFIVASAIITVAFLELIASYFGSSITGMMYQSGRLLELAAALLVFVIAVLLRQIRDELRTGQGS